MIFNFLNSAWKRLRSKERPKQNDDYVEVHVNSMGGFWVDADAAMRSPRIVRKMELMKELAEHREESS